MHIWHKTAIGYAYRALDWYREHGGPVDIANGAALVGSELCNAFRPSEAIEVLEPIVSADSALSEPAVVTAGAGLARAYLMALRDEEAAEMCERVIGPAERFGLTLTVVDTLITRGTALGNLGRMRAAPAWSRQIDSATCGSLGRSPVLSPRTSTATAGSMRERRCAMRFGTGSSCRRARCCGTSSATSPPVLSAVTPRPSIKHMTRCSGPSTMPTPSRKRRCRARGRG